jgi:hypothetical protein
MPGPIAAPRRRFSHGLYVALDADPRPILHVSIRAGLGNRLSEMRRNAFAATPRTVAKVRKVAELVGYDGPLFEDDESAAQHESFEDIAKNARQLLARTLHELSGRTVPLIDCAAAANAAIDEAADGNLERVKAFITAFREIIAKAEQAQATEPQP